jgi:hypothetical protein
VLDAGRLFSRAGSIRAQIAEIGGERNIIDRKILVGFHHEFGDFNAALPDREIVFLLAGDLA